MDFRSLLLYFVIGGVIVSGSAYFGSTGKGFLAAFITSFPSMTVVAFLIIYDRSHSVALVSEYARGLLFMLLPWVPYVLSMQFCLNRLKLGMYASLAISVALFVALSFLMMALAKKA
jgi:uncharacterized membrane protein (GlpM family)